MPPFMEDSLQSPWAPNAGNYRTLVAQHEANVAYLDSEIANLRAVLDIEYKLLMQHKAMIAPITRLPNEILIVSFSSLLLLNRTKPGFR